LAWGHRYQTNGLQNNREHQMNEFPNTIEEYKERIGNEVYAAVVGLYERAEFRSVIHGNGHHMAQAIAQQAIDLFMSRLKADAGKKSARTYIDNLRDVK
jgi:hypothetical protein